MTSLRTLIAGALLAVLVPAIARADDAAGLKAKLAEGLAGVTSVRILMTLPVGTGTTTVVFSGAGQRGLRAKMETKSAQAAMAMYIVDGYMYQSINGSRWEKRPLPDVASAVHLGPAFGDRGTLTPLPDRVENGVTYGAFSEAPPPPLNVPAATLDCTYDKATGRVHSCANALLTMTYAGYNDPANVVELPAAAKDAIELPAIPLVPPGMTPRPLGSP